MRWHWWTLVGALILGLAGCRSATPGARSDKLRVVVSIPPLAYFVKGVGGEYVEVLTLVSNSASPHTFEPLPEQIRVLSEADVIIFNGRGLEPWAQRIVEASGTQAEVFYITETADFEAAPYAQNAHLWMDVRWAKVYVSQIRTILEAHMTDQSRRNIYTRALTYQEFLNVLQDRLERTFGRVPPERRRVAVLHSVWEPFLTPFGFTVVSLYPQGYHVHEQQEPSPQDLNAWVQTMKREGVRAVVLEKQQPVPTLEGIATDMGFPTVYLDPLGAPPPEGNYEEMMISNAEALVQALVP